MEKPVAVYCIRLVSFSKPQFQTGVLLTAVRRVWSRRYVTATTDRMPRKTIKPEYDARS